MCRRLPITNFSAISILTTHAFFSMHCDRKTAKWPTQWNLSKNRHGIKEFAPGEETNNTLVHRDDGSANVTQAFPKDWTLSSGSSSYTFSHTVDISRPKLCGLDVQNDTRCDDARATLFGASTSVGQICSVAGAVLFVDPETGSKTPQPDNMPGTCCLDNVKSTANFGESVSTNKCVCGMAVVPGLVVRTLVICTVWKIQLVSSLLSYDYTSMTPVTSHFIPLSVQMWPNMFQACSLHARNIRGGL